MKTIHKLTMAAISFVAMATTALAEAPKGWTTDLDAAMKEAKEKNKAIMVEFTGSDWCAPCMKLRKDILSKEDFVTKASPDFVLVELDFPKADKELTKKNNPIAKKHKIIGYPTILLLDGEGKEFDRFFGSQFSEIDPFVARLKKGLDKKKAASTQP
jgi:thioredoxin-related protein